MPSTVECRNAEPDDLVNSTLCPDALEGEIEDLRTVKEAYCGSVEWPVFYLAFEIYSK